MQSQARLAAACLRFLEDIRKDAPDIVQCAFVPIDGNLLAGQVVKAAQVIHTEDMVGVGMRHQHGIHPAHIIRHRLQAQFRRRVHQDRPVFVPHQDRRPKSPVFWIFGAADGAVASDHWNPMRRPTPQYHDFQYC